MQISWSDEFRRQVKKLSRKHRLILDDISDFLDRLDSGERPGYLMRGLEGLPVRWARMPNSSARSGKSGGFRVVYFYDENVVLLITIDLRAEIDFLPAARIMRILSDAGLADE